jgi:hypothetical protein
MLLSAILEMLNASFMMLFLLILAMISPAKAQAVTCGPISPQCCWVRRSWQLMGKTTTVDPTSATACCYTLGTTKQTSGMAGVTCTSAGTVTKIDWTNKGLTGSIPPEIGNLTDLNYL